MFNEPWQCFLTVELLPNLINSMLTAVMAITKFYLNFFFSIEEVKISFTHLSQNRPYFVCLFAVTDIIS